MSDIDPKQQTTATEGAKLGAVPAVNPPKKLTVFFDTANNKFTYHPDRGGDLEFERKSGDGADFPIEFVRGDASFKFVAWTSFPPETAPRSGKPVLEVTSLTFEKINVLNRIEYEDEFTHTYKYSFAIELSNKQYRFADPEIENKREITLRQVTDH